MLRVLRASTKSRMTAMMVSAKSVEVDLGRMLDPVAAPVVVDLGVERLVLLIDLLCEELLQTLVAREGDVGSLVEGELALAQEGRGMAAMWGFLSKRMGDRPASRRWCAAPRPAMPVPRTQIFFMPFSSRLLFRLLVRLLFYLLLPPHAFPTPCIPLAGRRSGVPDRAFPLSSAG
ncbi:MAG: hypothetical protein R3F35_02015 [Myxococcota bacterium]